MSALSTFLAQGAVDRESTRAKVKERRENPLVSVVIEAVVLYVSCLLRTWAYVRTCGDPPVPASEVKGG